MWRVDACSARLKSEPTQGSACSQGSSSVSASVGCFVLFAWCMHFGGGGDCVWYHICPAGASIGPASRTNHHPHEPGAGPFSTNELTQGPPVSGLITLQPAGTASLCLRCSLDHRPIPPRLCGAPPQLHRPLNLCRALCAFAEPSAPLQCPLHPALSDQHIP